MSQVREWSQKCFTFSFTDKTEEMRAKRNDFVNTNKWLFTAKKVRS